MKMGIEQFIYEVRLKQPMLSVSEEIQAENNSI
jgi:hypothetical protein